MARRRRHDRQAPRWSQVWTVCATLTGEAPYDVAHQAAALLLLIAVSSNITGRARLCQCVSWLVRLYYIFLLWCLCLVPNAQLLCLRSLQPHWPRGPRRSLADTVGGLLSVLLVLAGALWAGQGISKAFLYTLNAAELFLIQLSVPSYLLWVTYATLWTVCLFSTGECVLQYRYTVRQVYPA